MNWLRTIFILAVAYVAVFLECTFGFFRHWIGAPISLLPALMVYTSLTNGIRSIAILAICGGLWLDSLSANPLGVTILPLFVIGYAIWLKRDLLLRESPFAQTTLGMAAGAAFGPLTLFLLLNAGASPLMGWGLVWQWIVAAMTGGILTPVCFRLFGRLEKALEYPVLKQTSFRPDREIKRGRM